MGPDRIVTIRRAVTGDLPRLVAMEAELFDDAWSEGALIRHVASESADAGADARAWVAEADAVVGYLLYEAVLEDATILRVGVSSTSRRRGIASRLIHAALEHAGGAGIERLWLEVAESNTAAIRLYRKFDFEVRGRRKGYYRTTPPQDALIMCREHHEAAGSGEVT